MTRILFATDGSKPSLSAETYISSVYDSAEDEVVVLSVAHVPHRLMQYLDFGDEDEDPYKTRIGQQFVQQARDHAEDAEVRLNEEGFDVESVVREGDPGSQICEAAEERDVDCIVVGRRGQSSASDPLLGSVSNYVLHHASRPVNVVPFYDAD